MWPQLEAQDHNIPIQEYVKTDYFRKVAMFSFRNFKSAGLLAAPAVWPQC